MPRPRNPFPQPRQHKGAAVIDLHQGGRRRTITLGPWGSEQAEAEYARLMAERKAAANPAPAGPDVTVNEVMVGFLNFAEGHYRRADGTQTDEVGHFKQTFRIVRELYGQSPAKEFGPLALKAVRQKMIDMGWTRKVVNQRVGRVKRLFKWAASEELIPAIVFQGLATVTGLQRGRSKARETAPILPVAEEHVGATLPHLHPVVAAMVRVQQLTGMRPGEVCRLRPCDIEASGSIWVYRPPQHKGAHRERVKAVAIGPRAQMILTAFAPQAPAAYYFSPRRVVEQLRAERSAARKTPRYKSHMARNAAKRKPAPKRQPGAAYAVTSYEHAIARGVEKANRALVEAGVEVELHVPHWHPNQLRHTHATEVRRRYGLEAAGAALGHDRLSTTEIYAEKNLDLAKRVAADLG